MGGMKLSVVLPTYNEAENLAPLLDRLEDLLGGRPGLAFEVIVVDDSSPDGTGRVAERCARKYGNIRLLTRPGKAGLSSAVLAGLRMAQGEMIAVMDADLQHPPEPLGLGLQTLEQGADLVVMSRYLASSQIRGRSSLRAWLSRSAILLTRLLIPAARPLSDPVSGFFLCRSDVIRGMTFRTLGYKILMEVLVGGSYRRLVELPYTFHPRAAGSSKLRLDEAFKYPRLLGHLIFRTRRPAEGGAV